MISSCALWNENECDERNEGRRRNRPPQRPRWLTKYHPRSSGVRTAPLGIQTRGSRRGTFKSLNRGKIRTQSIQIAGVLAMN